MILAAEKDCVYCDKNWEWWARVQTWKATLRIWKLLTSMLA